MLLFLLNVVSREWCDQRSFYLSTVYAVLWRRGRRFIDIVMTQQSRGHVIILPSLPASPTQHTVLSYLIDVETQ